MKVELIVIGSEVLSGHTVNTNLSFIGQTLDRAGYTLSRETVLPDNHEDLKSGFAEALKRSDLVVAAGGLGPTIDDVTRHAAAEVFESSFHFNETVAKHLRERFGEKFPTVEDQAAVPEKAIPLLNNVGTAPGLIFQEGKGTLILMPGIPAEMCPILTEQVLPFLKKKFPLKEQIYRRSLHFFELSENVVDGVLRTLVQKYPKVDFGIYPGMGVVSVTLAAKAKSASDADLLLRKPYSALEEHFATNCFKSDSGQIEEAVQKLFIEKGWTLSCAESCTGGAVAARITQHSGSSGYFLGSIVSYANELKTAALKVPAELIQEKGAVSEEVVSSMVKGALDLTGSDFALAVSGIAGPLGGTPEKPAGLVWCAVQHKDGEPHLWKLNHHLPRQLVILRSVNSLLSNLILYSKQYNV
ncbi:CinA-like protein [Waddlia chondrophila 2032/99]|uniref:CinA-like protein n=2 Tax=Waddlia chondrophila TaxID=71667 RepID=D6YSP3_WADCW|nr:CinA family nicotinamide mononucleotide deamidase-related protein [Waddlia chondrophila]ADI39088.1 CinA-like protein [Waddlia chondrophila WSU 86-1044]CCB92199.1 CinA-like protein [Waddlia chondrophila 2032/99]